MTADRIAPSPPLAPVSQEGWLTAAEGVDHIIRSIWQLHLDGDVSWRGAGRLHDALCELRDGGLR
jgi:hypothetical protein